MKPASLLLFFGLLLQAVVGSTASAAPIQLDRRGDRRACKRALQAVGKRRHAAKQAEEEGRCVRARQS